MKSSPTSILIVLFILGICPAFAQGKYFEVVSKKSNGSKTYNGYVMPANGQGYVVLSYQGKTKEQLRSAVFNYIKARPSLWIVKLSDRDERIEYGNFATIGDTSKCIVNLVSSTRVDVEPDNGQLKLYIGIFNQIYSSLYGTARFLISRDGVVVSENETPFNEYKFVQPDSRKEALAYPESVFDTNGKVVNPANKKTIEGFYDGYVADLKSYLDKNLK